MMVVFENEHPACVPASPIQRKAQRALPPVLAGIRADKSNWLTFLRRGTVVIRDSLPPVMPGGACFTVAGAAHVGRMNDGGIVFPV